MEVSYTQITADEDRKAPTGKYRVLMQDRSFQPSRLYLVEDYDSPEDAICKAETLNRGSCNGIVRTSNGFPLYPWFDGHQLHTRAELLQTYGREKHDGSRALSSDDVTKIENAQLQRIPGWKPGNRMVVFWRDIADATGARAFPGNF